MPYHLSLHLQLQKIYYKTNFTTNFLNVNVQLLILKLAFLSRLRFMQHGILKSINIFRIFFFGLITGLLRTPSIPNILYRSIHVVKLERQFHHKAVTLLFAITFNIQNVLVLFCLFVFLFQNIKTLRSRLLFINLILILVKNGERHLVK